MQLYWFSSEWMKEHGITWSDHISNPAVHKTESIQSDEEDEHVTDLYEQDDSDESIYPVQDFATKR